MVLNEIMPTNPWERAAAQESQSDAKEAKEVYEDYSEKLGALEKAVDDALLEWGMSGTRPDLEPINRILQGLPYRGGMRQDGPETAGLRK
jgi:hypothetical protein